MALEISVGTWKLTEHDSESIVAGACTLCAVGGVVCSSYRRAKKRTIQPQTCVRGRQIL